MAVGSELVHFILVLSVVDVGGGNDFEVIFVKHVFECGLLRHLYFSIERSQGSFVKDGTYGLDVLHFAEGEMSYFVAEVEGFEGSFYKQLSDDFSIGVA